MIRLIEMVFLLQPRNLGATFWAKSAYTAAQTSKVKRMTPSEIEPATCFELTRKWGRLWIATFNESLGGPWRGQLNAWEAFAETQRHRFLLECPAVGQGGIPLGMLLIFFEELNFKQLKCGPTFSFPLEDTCFIMFSVKDLWDLMGLAIFWCLCFLECAKKAPTIVMVHGYVRVCSFFLDRPMSWCWL